MKEEEKYIEHIKERWNFARKTVLEKLELKNHIADNIAITIFEKCVSPYHYFIGNDETNDDEKPTKKQIHYAKKLGIKDPEFYTKKDLSNKIDEVTKNG